MGKRLVLAVVVFVVICGVLQTKEQASAQVFNHQLRVYATVAEQRVIYIGPDGLISKIAGNTSRNIEPEVYDGNNHPVKMTAAIKTQYDQFLKMHNGHLQASKIYTVIPLKVDTTLTTQKIII